MAAKHIERLPLVVIVGPTASGKTSLAIELAEKFEGEIICADSRTIYEGMDIGTAKPTKEEQRRIPHWGLDLVEPGERFTVADFKSYAERKIIEIRARKHMPFLVGGTGLYIDAVIFNYQFGSLPNYALRQTFEKLTIEQLHKYCIDNSVILPENKCNKRYIIRAIEQKNINIKRQKQPIDASIIVGITTERDDLRKRIAQRSEQLFKNDVVKEATLLGKKYGWDSEAMTGNIYPLVHLYLGGEMTLENLQEKFTTLDWRLAKRQMTWLRRNRCIRWGTLLEVKSYLLTVLANE